MTDRDRTQIEPFVNEVVETVASWPGITTGEGRFNSTTFAVEDREIGHVHPWGPVDISYPQSLREQLVAEGETGDHHVVSDSNATTFHVEAGNDVDQAVTLLRLSYLYHVLVLQKRGGLDSALATIDVNDELAGMNTSKEIRRIFEDIDAR